MTSALDKIKQVLAEGEKLEAAATPGPWHGTPVGLVTQTAHITRDVWVVAECYRHLEDTKFIGDARSRLPLYRKAIEILCEALEQFELGHEHAPNLKHTRAMGDDYGWCDYCYGKVSWGPGIAEQNLENVANILESNGRSPERLE